MTRVTNSWWVIQVTDIELFDVDHLGIQERVLLLGEYYASHDMLLVEPSRTRAKGMRWSWIGPDPQSTTSL